MCSGVANDERRGGRAGGQAEERLDVCFRLRFLAEAECGGCVCGGALVEVPQLMTLCSPSNTSLTLIHTRRQVTLPTTSIYPHRTTATPTLRISPVTRYPPIRDAHHTFSTFRHAPFPFEISSSTLSCYSPY